MLRLLLVVLAVAGCARPATTKAEADPPLPGLPVADPQLAARLAAAAAARGEAASRYTNRLILETSPYLLQHAHNPVSWYAWGEEPFARARRERKPVLLSIGYSTCHWCHVMEEESFADEEIARTINEGYVAIKVDREERPDVDSLYMSAVILLAGRGGWPMTLVLTPEREPFFAATYLPARDGDRGSSRGFLTILRELRGAYQADPARAVATAREVTRRLAAAAQPRPAAELPGPAALHDAAARLARTFDADWGGWGPPKFPSVTRLAFLARYHRRTGDPNALRMLVTTLERMADGGIRDQIGGGFHRYATDARWIVPHFEKMLYDNAMLASLYLDGFQLTGRQDFARVARATLADLDRTLSRPDGAFAGATDADSADPAGRLEEGRYFTWTQDELDAALGAERARAFGIYFGVTERGQLSGRSVLYRSLSVERAAALAGLPQGTLAAQLDEDLATLGPVRAARPAPRRDDKAVVAWNGLAISAFARAAMVLDDERYARRAERAAAAILAARPLPRTLPGAQAAQLDDHALLALGLLDLHEATGDGRWLREARARVDTLLRDFLDDEAGGFFRTAREAERLLVRDKPTDDAPEPSGNAAAIQALFRLHELTGDERYRREAERALRACGAATAREGALLGALDFALDTPLEIVLVAPAGSRPRALERTVAAAYVPNRVLVVTAEGEPSDLPLLRDKRALHGLATAYVCRRFTCDSPTSKPEVLAADLARVQRLELPPLAP